ncbi:MAG: hypothetical protein PHU51_00065 [Candidatus Nanoarchaeia archaeon]|nr:hypothetical protein [Candidatus Nanoarchaeia archaeon]
MDEKSIEYEEVSKLFKKRISKEMNEDLVSEEKTETKVYSQFKSQYLPKHLSIYEKICQFSEKNLPISPDAKKIPVLQEAINTCHLNTTPTGVNSAAMIIPLALIVAAMIVFYILPVMLGSEGNLFFVAFSVVLALGIMIPLQNLPMSFANKWRMKASNQMVLSIFYLVTYMRHTSNLERAMNFAAEHLPPPLSLDFRKVVWNVETQKFDSIKDSLNDYLDIWRKHNLEFIESMNLIESSLMENTEDRRLAALDKSLNVMLDETYEKMLHYAHGLKGPLTTLNMLGVVLPILTLVILPLVVSFMSEFRWYHLFAIYNIFLPLIVFYLGKKILSTRPGGSGNVDVTKRNPELTKLQNIVVKVSDKKTYYFNPLYFSITVAVILCLIGFLPLIWHSVGLSDFALVNDDGYKIQKVDEFTSPDIIKVQFLEYRQETIEGEVMETYVGPFGLIATLLSLLIPFGIAFGIGFYNKARTKHIIGLRDKAKALELEFSAALFQLGSRIGDGIPTEIAFGKVGSQMTDTISGKFFLLVHSNITRQGMSVEKAIFDSKIGALSKYPSDIIESSMKVLVEASRKGPIIASQAMMNVSEYIKQMHRVDERLQDLMGDTIASMKSQLVFLTPVISAIVVAITSLITKIMGTLGNKLSELGGQASGLGAGGAILTMFGTGIPTYYFTLVVGLYVVQLAYILTVLANGIENGADDLGEQASLGNYMYKAASIFFLLAVSLIILFNLVSGSILSGLY